tara:strand:+ start:4121 stop:5413 length:1293 start_codon:yes stop_codon:yes gene_type:complete
LIKLLALKFLLSIFLLSSCALLDDEDENILPGKRESVYESEEKVILKARKRIKLEKPKIISNWSQQHQNLKNHLFHFKSKSTLKLKKRIRLGDINLDKIQYITPPIISENIIFYSDNDYNIISKNIDTGKLNWSIKLEFEKEENFSLVSGFFLDNKTLFFSTGLGNVYAVNAIEGKIKWSKKFGIQFSRPPVISKNRIFLVSDDNQLYAINKTDGEVEWSHLGNIEELSIIGGSKPALDQGIIVVSYSSGEIFALDESNGSVIWFDNVSTSSFFSKTNINDIQSPICIENERLFVPTFSNKLLVYDLKTGKKSWDVKLSSISPMVISGEIIYVIDINGKLMSIDKISGKLLWAVQLRSKKGDKEINWSGPLLSSYKLLVVSSEGTVLSLSPFTGETISKIKIKGSFISEPIQVNEKVYLISKEGSLYILE